MQLRCNCGATDMQLSDMDVNVMGDLSFNHETFGERISFRDTRRPPMSSRLVIMLKELMDNPLTKPKDIIKRFKTYYGVDLEYYFAYAGRNLAMTEIYGDAAKSYSKLVQYIEALKKSNLGSHTVLEVDPKTRQFQRHASDIQTYSGANFCNLYAFNLETDAMDLFLEVGSSAAKKFLNGAPSEHWSNALFGGNSSYMCVVQPVPNFEMPIEVNDEDKIEPLACRPHPGRPSKKRKESIGAVKKKARTSSGSKSYGFKIQCNSEA
ncbi:hypothetical protein BVC80_1291g13 [Macleaya cordata]|uniref:Uncharacterized protein n=1 Tax=Macleaya cordata TaxID=56857 RepID=A0A200QDP5_MACCD|nr:hypothetical protein BVC80_1291g13 [Macleaya cordata]